MKAARALAIAMLSTPALAACASYSDVRGQAPIRAETFAGNPTSLAGCTLEKLQLKHATGALGGQTFQKLDVGPKTHITSQLNGWSGPIKFIYDLSFEPAGAGKTSVELRAESDVWGRPQAAVPDLFETIKGCSAPT